MQFSCTNPRGNHPCDLRTMASNLCFENGWRRTTKFQVAVDNQRQMEPAVKKEIYNASRLGLSTVQGGANQEIFNGEVQTIGSSCSSNCKMLEKSQI